MYLKMSRNSCDTDRQTNIWLKVFRHEMFHVFGITHTQRRKDRQKYIRVLYANIKRNKRREYDQCFNCDIPPGIPYECNSIMHYKTSTFAIGDKPTMKSINERKCKTRDLQKTSYVPTENDWKVLRYAVNC